MEDTRAELLQKLLNSYSKWYDISLQPAESEPFVARGEFHEQAGGYMLVKSAQTWSADRNEYVYFFSVPHLTKADAEQFVNKARELGEARVNPDKNHMSSNIVMVALCDEADADALAAVKAVRIRKSFQFSLKGWMEVHAAVIEVGKTEVTANFAGYNTAKFLKSILCPKAKRTLFGRKKNN